MSPSSRRNGGHCTALVRHLGAVLGLRGKEAYRRPGPSQPVWRKRETLIQERIVQYTTLDEEGTVRARHVNVLVFGPCPSHLNEALYVFLIFPSRITRYGSL